MKSNGNGNADLCMQNLLRLRQGEVRFDILRGIKIDIIDKPATFAIVSYRAEAYWLITNYEPRVNFSGVELENLNAEGELTLTTNTSD